MCLQAGIFMTFFNLIMTILGTRYPVPGTRYPVPGTGTNREGGIRIGQTNLDPGRHTHFPIWYAALKSSGQDRT